MHIEFSDLISKGEEIQSLNDPIQRARDTLEWIKAVHAFVNSISDSSLQYEAKKMMGDEINRSTVNVGDRILLAKIVRSLRSLKTLAEESRISTIMEINNKSPNLNIFPTSGSILDTTFDEYTLEKQLGEGGAGTVFSAKNKEGKSFAVKILKQNVSTEKRKRFKNEIGFCIKNVHRGIITILDHGIFASGPTKFPFYVMPLYQTTFRAHMTNLQPKDCLSFMLQLLDAMECAHLQKCFHRDLKPENILMDQNFKIIVADFGIAHFEEQDLLTIVETTHVNRLANFMYAAPEQKIKGAIVDHRADIYALGLIFNEMFTKQVPQGADIQKVSDVAPEYKYLDEIIEKMRSQNPDKRYQNIQEIKDAIALAGKIEVSNQKLNELNNSVIEKIDASDNPFVNDPIKIIDFDHDGRNLVCSLNKAPPDKWISIFHGTPHAYNLNTPPDNASFRADRCNYACDIEKGDQAAEALKGFIQTTNSRYAAQIEKENKKAEEERLRAIAEKTEFERKRRELFSKLKV